MKQKILFILCLGFALFSCQNEVENNTVIVNLTPSMNNITEENNTPMKVAAQDTSGITPLYAIQIYENDQPYYYGLFNDITKMQIALTTGKKYTFKVAAYKNGTGCGLKTEVDTAGVNYFLPLKTTMKNKFIKGDLLKDIDQASSAILNDSPKLYPEIDVFYSTKSLTLEAGTTSIDFNMLRMGFGIYLSVDAITTGKMEIYIGDDTIKLDANNATASTVRQFNTAKNNFNIIHESADNFTDTILIAAKWIGENGTIINLSNKFKFQRNYQKTLSIQLNAITNNFTFDSWKSIPRNGLTAWYPFNGNANDQSGNGYNGAVYDATPTTDRFGNINNAYLFNGSTSYISTSCTQPSGTSARTFSFWAQVAASPSTVSDCRVIHYGGTEAGSAVCICLSDYFNLYRFDIGNCYKLYQYNLPYNVWHMYTIVVPQNASVSDILMYIDGKLMTDYTYRNPTSYSINTTTDYPIIIGRATTYDYIRSTYHNFAGKLDDIAIWNRALSSEEITDVYNARD